MKISERSYKNLDKSVKVVGIEDIEFGRLDALVAKLQNGKSLHQYVATIPEKIVSNGELLNFDGVPFAKLSDTKGLIKNSKSIEDVIILLVEPSQKLNAKGSSSNDPYLGLKNLCLDKKTLVLFFSPQDRDVDIFMHESTEKEIVNKLKI